MPSVTGVSCRSRLQVVYHNLRPEFPAGFDVQYVELSTRCWAKDPELRPSADQVVQCVGEMLVALRDKVSIKVAQAVASVQLPTTRP